MFRAVVTTPMVMTRFRSLSRRRRQVPFAHPLEGFNGPSPDLSYVDRKMPTFS